MNRFLPLVAVAALASSLLAQLQTRRTFVEADSGVKIETDLDDDTFPATWKLSPIFAMGKALDGKEVDRAVGLVRKAVSAYPPTLLKKELRRVVLLKSMTYYGYSYGGTNSRDTVYVCDDGASSGYTDRFVEGALHHEFSSILLRNHPDFIDQEAWKKALPPDFKYRGDGLTSVKTGTASLEYDEGYMKKGFLNQYATSSQEEDLNVTVEALMTGRKELWDGMEANPLLKAKTEAVMTFYGKLDKQFTRDWFLARKAG